MCCDTDAFEDPRVGHEASSNQERIPATKHPFEEEECDAPEDMTVDDGMGVVMVEVASVRQCRRRRVGLSASCLSLTSCVCFLLFAPLMTSIGNIL